MNCIKSNYEPAKTFGYLLDELFTEVPVFWKGKYGLGTPATNIIESNEAYHLTLNVPGRAKEDFVISVENELLTIAYQNREADKANPEGQKTIREEFSFPSFKRSFSLDNKIETSTIQASYENGLLKLVLPKKAPLKQATQQIAVQ